MRVLCVFLIFLVAVLGFLDRYFYKHNRMFNLNCVIPRWSHCPQIETQGDEQFSSLFHQPFFHLSQGKQSFVFKSEDGKWVLKLCRLPRYAKIGSLKGKKESLDGLEKMFESVCYSSEMLKEETGVIYTHLRPTKTLHQTLQLIDASHHPHLLSIDRLPFFIQHCGEDFFTYLKTLNEEETKKLIQKTVALYTSLYEKGFIDQDPIFEKNFGIHDGSPFIMDVGQLEPLTKEMSKEEYLLKMLNSLDIYLRENAPQFYDFYRNLLH